MELIYAFLNKRKVRFIMAGVINTLVGYFLFAALFYILDQKEASLTISTFSMLFISYFINYKIVFRDKGKSFHRYIMVFVSLYIVNILLLALVVEYLSLTPYIAQLFIVPFMLVIRFYLNNKFVFRAEY